MNIINTQLAAGSPRDLWRPHELFFSRRRNLEPLYHHATDTVQFGGSSGVQVAKFTPTVWMTISKVLYPTLDYVHELHGVLRSYGIHDILDACCGTGFPALALAQLGEYRIRCSDADSEMIQEFNQNKNGSQINPIPARWDELPAKVEGQFDLVMCRGNSLPYAGTSGGILASLSGIASKVKQGKFAYIDIVSEREEEDIQNTGKFHLERKRWVDGQRVHLVWDVHHQENKRILNRTLTINGDRSEKQSISYVLTKQELVRLAKDAGFEGATWLPLKHEPYYQACLLQKTT